MDHNIDNGVYSANSSRDSTLTPKGNHHTYKHEQIVSPNEGLESDRVPGLMAASSGSAELLTTSRARVVNNYAPRRQGGIRGESQRVDQEKLVTYTEEPTKHRMRRAELSRGNLTPVTLSLASKSIDVGEEDVSLERSSNYKRRSCDVDQLLRRSVSPPQISRRASATPKFAKTEPQTAVLKKEAAGNFPRSMSPASPKKAGAALESLRSLSPTSTSSSTSTSSGRESMSSSLVGSPEDIKLVSASDMTL